MKEEIEKAIKKLVAKAGDTELAPQALSFSQAALNLAHALSTFQGAVLKTR